eukprot:363717-Chlamydomonas_euryale.AAC.13
MPGTRIARPRRTCIARPRRTNRETDSLARPLSRPTRGARYRGRRLMLRCGCSKNLAEPQWPLRPQDASSFSGLLGRQRRGWEGNWSGLPTTANARAVA